MSHQCFKEKIRALIVFFGNQNKTAAALKVSQSTVSGWLTAKHGMSEVTALRAQIITKNQFLAADLCPDLKDLFGREKIISGEPVTT